MSRAKKIIQISILGIVVNLILVAFKAGVGLISHSIAIVLDAINNLSDAFSSLITILGTKLAAKPADKAHPYGYGKIEYITSVSISILILFAGFSSLQESIEKIFHPQNPSYSTISLLIVALGVVVKFFLGLYVRKEGKQLKSDSLIASGTDAFYDSIVSLSTLIGALLFVFFHINIGGYLGVVISIVILKAGIDVLKESLSHIIGARIESDLSRDLKAFLDGYENVLGAYDLTLHQYGPEKIIGSVHLEVPDSMTAREIHALSRQIMEDIFQNYGIVLTIGIYTSNADKPLYSMIKEKLLQLAKKEKAILQIHGFYVDEKTNEVSFDIILDFDCPNKKEICQTLIRQMEALYPDYHFNVILDSDFSV